MMIQIQKIFMYKFVVKNSKIRLIFYFDILVETGAT
jgi:hypothetical protein